jgi:hypothetical protein
MAGDVQPGAGGGVMGAERDGLVDARARRVVARPGHLPPHLVGDDQAQVCGGAVELLAQRGGVRQPGRLDQRRANESVGIHQDLTTVERDP